MIQNWRTIATIFTLSLLLSCSLSAQIHLENPSFEDPADDATVPTGWHPCKQGTTPDILPGSWGVQQEASDGETYMGLITRADGTWESVGQRLRKPLKAKDCYTFSLDLSRSDAYAGYVLPLKLVVWGGRKRCSKDQKLGETELIKHTEWKNYKFQFVPKAQINYIIFEAQYMDGIYFSYEGNILLDACSAIFSCQRASL
ncbi:MAG: hypothetical protein AAGG75_24705 [Bacteroidota bacterium]